MQKNDASDKSMLVPLTGFVRVPLPSAEERTALTESLREASAEIRAGTFSVFDKDQFIDWLMQGQDGSANLK
jgi:hypothetical protein